MEQPIVVGCGAGFSADRLDPACALAESGRVGYLVLRVPRRSISSWRTPSKAA